jgi:hypothetical protein
MAMDTLIERLIKEGLNAQFLEGGLKAWMDSGQRVEDIPV